MATDLLDRPMGATVKYNPHLWSDDELRDIFVARQGRLEELLGRIRSTPPDVAPQATLLVGARGMGKTTLLRRLALAIRDDPELSRSWLPLSFPEEQYTVSGLGELWRNVLDALIDALERGGASRSEIADLDRQARELAQVDADAQADQTLALLDQWCQANQRRLLLLIDSTDLLLEGLRKESRAPATRKKAAGESRRSKASASKDSSALWQLRATILKARHLMWVGASYQSLEAEHAYDDAFHDFFDLVELGPLSVEDMRDALLALAARFGGRGGQNGEQAVLAMRHELDTRPERLSALRSITGGNPRTTAILYDLFAAGTDGDLHTDLRGLLDQMTPLYKARMEQLAEQPRKVLAHVMEAWEPISLRDLAQAAGIPSTTVSSQLVRLEQDGLIQKTALRETSRTGYQVTERFFNIWFLMRHASRRVRQRLMWLVEFMRLWYRRDEIEGLAERRASFHDQHALSSASQAEYSRAIARAMPEGHELRMQLDYSVYRDAREQAEASNRHINDIYPELFDLHGEDKPYLAGEQCHERFGEIKKKLLQIPAEEGLDVAAWAKRVLGAVEADLSEKRALAAATEMLTAEEAERRRLFPLRARTREHVERAFEKRTIDLVESALADGSLLPDCGDLQFFRVQIAATLKQDADAQLLALLRFLGTGDKAGNLEAAEYIEQLRPKNAWCWLLLGDRIGRFDSERATKAFERAAALDPRAASRAQSLLGHLLQVHLKRPDEAEAAHRKAVALDRGDREAWIGLGYLLHQTGRHEEAEAAYREAIALNGFDVWPWILLGDLLHEQLKRHEEAEQAYRNAIALDSSAVWPRVGLGNVLRDHLARYDEAEAAYRKAAALHESDAQPWYGLSFLLHTKLQRHAEAEAAYRKAIALDESQPWPWASLANLLQDHLKRFDQAEAAYRRAIALNEADASSWNNLGDLLRNHLGRYSEAEAAYRKAIALDDSYALPWINLGNLLHIQLGRYGEAEAAYRQAIALGGSYKLPWNNLGNLLQTHLALYEEAEAAYRRAIAQDAADALPWNNLAILLKDHFKRYDEAEAAYRKSIALNESYAPPWVGLGSLLQYRLKRYGEAEAAHRKAIALDESDAVPWCNLGNLLNDHLKRYDEAEAAYRRAVTLDNSDAVPWCNLGNLLQDHLKRYDEAEAAYHRAITLDESSARPWTALGNLLHEHLERYGEAEVAYRKAIALDESNTLPWFRLGDLLKDRLQRYDEAEAAYRKAIALDDSDALPWNNLGTLLQRHLKRPDEAEAAYRMAIALNESDASPWNNLGNLLQDHLKRYDEAEAAYRKAIASDEASAIIWNNLGNLLRRHLKRYEEAEAAYRKAIALNESYATARINLGILLHDHLRRYDEAETSYRMAIALQEPRAWLWNRLGNLLQDHLLRDDDASVAYAEAEKIDPEDPYPWANHARLWAGIGRSEDATVLYRRVIDLCADKLRQAGTFEDAELLLQAHLWLGNTDFALQSLDQLADQASKGDSQAFGKLREQAFECHKIGIGTKLADLCLKSAYGDFLAPLELALRAAEHGSDAPLEGIAEEVRTVALEVLRELTEVTSR